MAIYRLGAQNHPNVGSFISLRDGSIYLFHEAIQCPENVDAVYFYTQRQGVAFGAPADPAVYAAAPNGIFEQGLENLFHTFNNTHFRKLQPEYYNSQTFESVFDSNQALADAYNNAPDNPMQTRINHLQEGDVVGYWTVGDIYGAFLIKDVRGTDSGTCDIEIIVQG